MKKPSTKSVRTFRNFQPNDYLADNNGTIFQIKSKLTYLCKCEKTHCEEHRHLSSYELEAVQTRKRYELDQAYITQKYLNHEIHEATYTKGKWNY